MKVKANKTFTHNNRQVKAGDWFETSTLEAHRLLDIDYVSLEQKKPIATKEEKAVKKTKAKK